MKRPVFKGIAVLVLLLAPLLAYAAPTPVTLWDFLSGGDGVRWRAIIDQFNSSQNKIVVNATTLTWGDPFYTKVHTAVVAGDTPDVMTYHLSHFPAGIKAGDLRPITEAELKMVGLSFKDFNPALMTRSLDISKAYGTAGVIYGIPLDTHTSIIYYNKDLLKQAGLLGANGEPVGFTGIDAFTKCPSEDQGHHRDPSPGHVLFQRSGHRVADVLHAVLPAGRNVCRQRPAHPGPAGHLRRDRHDGHR